MQEITAFSNLSDMKAILEGMGTDFFDTVAYDDDEEPTKIVCTQDGHTILEVSQNGTQWTFTPFIADDTTAHTAHIFAAKPIEVIYKFSGGLYIESTSQSGSQYVFALGKTSAGKTGFIAHSHPTGGVSASLAKYYLTCFGDNSGISLYTNGFEIKCNSINADRTILSKLPVIGASGSTDSFTSVYARNVMQFAETGQQLIGGKHYGCVKYLAFMDDE